MSMKDELSFIEEHDGRKELPNSENRLGKETGEDTLASMGVMRLVQQNAKQMLIHKEAGAGM